MSHALLSRKRANLAQILQQCKRIIIDAHNSTNQDINGTFSIQNWDYHCNKTLINQNAKIDVKQNII